MQQDISSPQFWTRVWEEAIANTPKSASAGYASSRTWDRMAVDYDRWDDASSDAQDQEDRALLATLTDRGLFREGMRVLDVGCGTGRMAMVFAKHGAQVHALDFSPAMLDRLREALPASLAQQVLPVEADWSDVDLASREWERAFDLVFACLTPAIQTPEALLKLHEASRGGCYFRGWADWDKDPLLEDLRHHLTGESAGPSPAGRAGSVIYAFNLLYAMGRSPWVEFQDVSWEARQPITQATSFYEDYFAGQADGSPEELGGRISDYLATVAEDGHVTRRTAGRTGSITWTVPQP